jgi:Uma2 family endonuclease
MTLPRRDAQYHAFGDYLIWSRTSGDELIDGTAYVKEPPSPTWSHQAIVFELALQIERALEETQWRVFVAPLDVRLPRSTEQDNEIDTVVQPDVFITRGLHKIDSRGLRGAPDWLAEVLSPTTASYDRSVKIPVYERAGVPEVWLINPSDRSVAIYRLEKGHYARPTILRLNGHTRIAAVPGVIVNWDRMILRVFEAG